MTDSQGKAQAQMYQRSVSQFERQQRRLELEHNELMSRVSRLNDEVCAFPVSFIAAY